MTLGFIEDELTWLIDNREVLGMQEHTYNIVCSLYDDLGK